ncbi:MAG: SAM-dependent chlorinase/fluorinase [Rhodothermales bacterium]|nr:SAM-dependent chlorinase/fluorinase [Rhodothermales bacterium]
MDKPLITLTTDFGTSDGYVAAMKATILSIAGDVPIVDISHSIAPQDVMEAAFVLQSSAPYFPAGTVHIVVVDPGVGTSRKSVGVSADGQYYVGPDNGIFTLALNGSRKTVVELDQTRFWRTHNPSNTFHGRDIFSAVAAHLANGIQLDEVGTPIEELKPMHWALPISDDEGIQGWVVHVDHYGNCITNISRKVLSESRRDRRVKCYVGNHIVEGIHSTYGGVATSEPVVLFNSVDFLEIAVNCGNASELMGLAKGSTISLLFQSERQE